MNRKHSSELPTADHSPAHSPNVAPTQPPQAPGNDLPNVDALGRQFENDWRLKKQPKIEDFLQRVSAPSRGPLFRQLLERELEFRAGQDQRTPTINEYRMRFPEYGGLITGVFNALGLKDNKNSTVAWRPVEPSARSGRYAMREFHARGGMGEVWRAYDSEIGRQVALKRMLNERGGEYIERFLAEAQITGQLEHPSIVPVHDMGLDEKKQPYYIMKFVEGQNLRDLIEEHHSEEGRRSSLRQVQQLRLLDIFVRICQAVAYSHHRGVIHRDIKPANVMLGPFGETLVMDWGLAKVLDQPDQPADPSYEPLSGVRGSSKTAAGATVGTPNYMSPEAAEGKSHDLDRQADVYLLGATLFEILAAQPPRQGTSREEVLEIARSSPAISPRKVNKQTPKPLAAICLKAMARRKQDRYANVEALADDVQRYIAGEKVLAHREGMAMAMWRLAKRRRRDISWATAAMLILALGAIAVHSVRKAGELQRQQAASEGLHQLSELSDEVRYILASSNPMHEKALDYDLARGKRSAGQAFDLMSSWGSNFEDWPLSEAPPRQELYELHLLLAHAMAEDGENAQTTTDALAHLDRAQELATPTREYYKLRAKLFEQQGESANANQSRQQASDANTPTDALDHFLVGEEFRRRSASDIDPQINGDTPEGTRRLAALQNAVNAYQRALQARPNHFWSRLQLGRCYLALGLRDEAVEALGACIALQPNSPWGYTARGLALALSGRHDEALEDLNHHVVEDFRPAILNRGVAHLLHGNGRKALADFDAVLQGPQQERLDEALLARAQLLMRTKTPQWNKVFADLNAFIAKRSNSRQAYLLRAEAYFRQGRNQAALDDLTTYLGWEPGAVEAMTGPAHFERGRLIRRMLLKNRAPKAALQVALAQLAQAKQLGAGTAELFLEEGFVFARLGKRDPALAAWDRAAKAAPAGAFDLVAEARNQRGTVFVNREDFSEAITELSQALPKADAAQANVYWLLRANVLTLLGYAYAGLREQKEALDYASKTVELGREKRKDHVKIRYNLACVYARLSKETGNTAYDEAAMEHLRAAARIDRKGQLNAFQEEPWLPDSLKNREDFKALMVD